jgi:hypothetical protein
LQANDAACKAALAASSIGAAAAEGSTIHNAQLNLIGGATALADLSTYFEEIGPGAPTLLEAAEERANAARIEGGKVRSATLRAGVLSAPHPCHRPA